MLREYKLFEELNFAFIVLGRYKKRGNLDSCNLYKFRCHDDGTIPSEILCIKKRLCCCNYESYDDEQIIIEKQKNEFISS
ncbi:unnamed protein product [Allacma fusca]|uniref:Uncharacterized protein n=1 Tax=Allacma fusca TaxID=39272 RepID=A0A8J2LFJ4_9HEXA|nr:unnamed protein product [Allacma fusca]